MLPPGFLPILVLDLGLLLRLTSWKKLRTTDAIDTMNQIISYILERLTPVQNIFNMG